MENALQPIDAHVHIVGNGSSGSGCWLRIPSTHKPLAGFMMQHIGLPFSAASGDLDRLYVDRLLELTRGSSLSKIVILAHDHVYDAHGQPVKDFGSFYVPNDYVLGLARTHPEFLPAVSIHPGRPDALEELERSLEGGAVMMKCLPNCNNIDCSDVRYTRFWERMAEARLPLLAHTGGEHTVPVYNTAYADPRYLQRPLEIGVTVIAAHCATKSGLFDPEYFNVWAGMLSQFPTLYGDTSAFNVPIRGRHIRACLQEPVLSRLVHGSDFPVPVYGHWAWMQGFISWRDYRRCQAIPNVLERDFQLKIAMGFGPEHFTRIAALLRNPSGKASAG